MTYQAPVGANKDDQRWPKMNEKLNTYYSPGPPGSPSDSKKRREENSPSYLNTAIQWSCLLSCLQTPSHKSYNLRLVKIFTPRALDWHWVKEEAKDFHRLKVFLFCFFYGLWWKVGIVFPCKAFSALGAYQHYLFLDVCVSISTPTMVSWLADNLHHLSY